MGAFPQNRASCDPYQRHDYVRMYKDVDQRDGCRQGREKEETNLRGCGGVDALI